MKFVHLSDLHLGKRVNGFSLLEDQRYILRQILEIVEREAPDACSSPAMYTINRCPPLRQWGCWTSF